MAEIKLPPFCGGKAHVSYLDDAGKLHDEEYPTLQEGLNTIPNNFDRDITVRVEPGKDAPECEELKPCPFCGGQAHIVVSDDEGNLHDEEYEKNPWSGLTYGIQHIYEDYPRCPIAKYECDDAIMGVILYESREEAIRNWNMRESEGW